MPKQTVPQPPASSAEFKIERKSPDGEPLVSWARAHEMCRADSGLVIVQATNANFVGRRPKLRGRRYCQLEILARIEDPS